MKTLYTSLSARVSISRCYLYAFKALLAPYNIRLETASGIKLTSDELLIRTLSIPYLLLYDLAQNESFPPSNVHLDQIKLPQNSKV